TLKALIDRLNGPTREALESAAALSLSQTHYEVGIKHLVAKLADIPNGDLQAIFKRFGVNASRFSRDLIKAMDQLKRGNAGGLVFSPRINEALAEAWMI